MRLWHKDLIEVLPRQQLLGQWRELNSIYKKQDKHILINFVYDYPKEHLKTYSLLVIKEMKKREYKINMDNFYEYFEDKFELNEDKTIKSIKLGTYFVYNDDEVYQEKMNDEYLKICYYNLLEKYRCGGISQEEWQKIGDKFGGVM